MAFVQVAADRLGVGCSCFVRADGDTSNKRPFVAKILALDPDYDYGGFNVRVQWYYRPEDPGIPGGRKPFHGERELYSSDHTDTIHSATILGRCAVHSISSYRDLELIRPQDYYSRFSYSVSTKQFSPENVSVYCVCHQPENPDRPMCQCDFCQEWYHPNCCHTTLAEVEACSMWSCPSCEKRRGAPTQPAVAAPPAATQHPYAAAPAPMQQAYAAVPAATQPACIAGGTWPAGSDGLAASAGGYATVGLAEPLLDALQAQLRHSPQQFGWQLPPGDRPSLTTPHTCI